MKKLLTTFFIISGTLLFSQNGFIKGTVSDSKTKETLVGVRVILDDTTGTVTDIFGNYLLKANPGKHSIKFKFIGAKNQGQEINVSASDTLVLNILMEGESQQLGTVVVSAGRFEQKIEEVTVSMEVLRPQLVENKSIQTMDKAVDYVPGVNVVDGQANIRGGAGYSYGAGSRVLMVVDEMPMLAADAGDIRWSFLPIENCEQVEIIKGASSALFGSSAMNGVIHFRTGYAKEDPETKINIFTGVYCKPKRDSLVWWKGANPSYSGVNFYHAQKIKQLDLVIGGNAFNDAGYRMGEQIQRYRMNVNLRYRFKKIEGLSVGLNLNAQQHRNGLFFLWESPDSALVPSGGSADQTMGIHFTIDPFLVYNNAKNNTKHTLRGRMFRKDVRNPVQAGDDTRATYSDLYYSEYQFQKRFAKNFTWTAGTVFMYSETHSPGLFGSHYSNNFALFSQFDKKFKRLTLSFGIRGEYFKTDSIETRTNINLLFDEARPIAKQSPIKPVMRAGLNYQVFDFTHIRASFGQGYRFPSVSERFIRTSGAGFEIYPNAALNPESGWTAEIGLKQGLAIGENWRGYLDVSCFISEYNDMMEFVFGQYGDPLVDPSFGVGFQSRNIGNTRVRGFEISIMGQGKINNVITVSTLIGYTYIDPRQTNFVDSIHGIYTSTGTSLLKYRYEHSGKGDIEFGYKKIATGFSVRANSFMANIDVFLQDPYYFPGMKEYREAHDKGDAIFDYRLSYQMHEKMKLSFIIDNMFNREVMGRPADIQKPRVFALQLTAKL